jgi:hypothetical protein
MKLKLLLLIAGVAMVGSTISVLVILSHPRQVKFSPPSESQLPTAMSNYSKTFKLNTSPPIWAQPPKQGATNGSTAN